MRIFHVVESLFKYGGANVACVDFANRQANIGHDVALFTTGVIDSEQIKIEETVKYVFKCKRINLKIFRISYIKNLNGQLKQALKDFSPDIVHVHALWDPITHSAIRYASKFDIPIVHSPHGMLTSWSLNNKKYKKKFAWFLYQKKDLEKVSCFHVTCNDEKQDVLKLGFKQPIKIIPLGIELPNNNSPKDWNKLSKKILFISRIHPKKGLMNLVEAWGKIRKDNWKILVCGPDDDNHLKDVTKRVKELNLEQSFIFIGPVEGEYKKKLFEESNLFVLPTYSENFGIVILEALSFGLPVITTVGSPWEDIKYYNAGWWIDIGIESLHKALVEFLYSTDETKARMSANAIKLVREKYLWSKITEDILNLYENTIRL